MDEALTNLRNAIVAVLDDDMDMVGEPVATTSDLIRAWNNADLGARIEDPS